MQNMIRTIIRKTLRWVFLNILRPMIVTFGTVKGGRKPTHPWASLLVQPKTRSLLKRRL